ncbi:toxin [Ralstonia flatus]|uniref:Toxin HigB-2 n=1 Tax=Ralstonia flatus TaxID=3058601 RepID=A0AAD2F7G2_9RALS|nr:toxin [Ralstonia sp. LMG 32965]MBN6209300.1 toxin [Ralstonia pickettii]CAJ0857397.1 Toxin HigB-2 [Ralstonia sp. LMG 32965]CAJ0862477.1 Toxin HigB-2 [Ralstonia sp. LMG 32965]
MEATFIELPPFQRLREHYLSDDEYRALQYTLLAQPDVGDVIKGTGGLRKMRFSDKRRGKGKRGGLRVIYYYWDAGGQFWMFAVYDKDEASDLSSEERKSLAQLLEREVKARSRR